MNHEHQRVLMGRISSQRIADELLTDVIRQKVQSLVRGKLRIVRSEIGSLVFTASIVFG
tara:strand:+ start:858 stop:1034 length:177 start_codon:yes stop_codon:yes gene_type:complete